MVVLGPGESREPPKDARIANEGLKRKREIGGFAFSLIFSGEPGLVNG
jgi:hypothetical protein